MAIGAVGPALAIDGWETSERTGRGTAVLVGSTMLRTFIGASDVSFAEVNFGSPFLEARLEVPNEGPLFPSGLEDLAGAPTAPAMIAWDIADGQDLLAQGPSPGIRWSGGRLVTWAPRSGTHFVVESDGNLLLAQPESKDGLVAFDGETTLTLASINGAFPSASGEATLLTGTLTHDRLPALRWPAEMVLIGLVPADSQPDPNTALAAGTTRFLVTHRILRRDLRITRANSWLVMPEGTPLNSPIGRPGSLLTITAPLQDSLRLARLVAPVETVLMQPGQRSEDTPGKTVRNVLAFRTGRAKALFLSVVSKRGQDRPLPVTEILDLLRSQRYDTAVEISSSQPALLVRRDTEEVDRSIANTPTMVGLLASRGQTALRLDGLPGFVAPLAGFGIAGTGTELPLSTPAKLLDQKAETWWAARFQKSDFALPPDGQTPTPNTLSIELREPTALAGMELIHAEAAGFSPQFSLRAWRLLGRSSPREPWRSIAEADHQSPSPRERIAFPNTPMLAQMRLEILKPNFLPNGDVARLSGLILWRAVPSN